MSLRKTTRDVMRELAALDDPKMREANERRSVPLSPKPLIFNGTTFRSLVAC